MNKELRKQVFDKYGGHCAYCGRDLEFNRMQVDHIWPVQRGLLGAKERLKKQENIESLNPACGRCNRYKSTMDLETFRKQLSKQVQRARNKSWNFRMAEDFGLVAETGNDVIFYFEKYCCGHPR